MMATIRATGWGITAPPRCCVAALAVITSALLVGSFADASITVLSAERHVSVLVDIPDGPGMFINHADDFTGPDHWAADLLSSCSPTTFSTSSQKTLVNKKGISGSHSVSGQATFAEGMTTAVATAISRLDVTFEVERFTLFVLLAEYEFLSFDGLPPQVSPFLSVAGNDLFLPDPAGFGTFGLTLALQPGVYTFTAIAAAGALVSDGDLDFSASTLNLNYSFTEIPAPAVLPLLAALLVRRRRHRV